MLDGDGDCYGFGVYNRQLKRHTPGGVDDGTDLHSSLPGDNE